MESRRGIEPCTEVEFRASGLVVQMQPPSHLDRGTRRKVGLKPPCLSESAFEMADAAALQEEIPGWERYQGKYIVLQDCSCYMALRCCRQSGELGAGLHETGIGFQPARIYQRIRLPVNLSRYHVDGRVFLWNVGASRQQA